MARKKWLVAGGIAAFLLIASTIGFVVGYPLMARSAVRAAFSRWEKRFGRRIRYSKIEVGWGQVEVRDVRVRGPLDCPGAPLLHAASVKVKFSPVGLLTGNKAFTEMVVTRPRICVIRHRDGRDNVSDLIRRLRKRKIAPSRRPRRLYLKKGSVRAQDHVTGWKVVSPAVSAQVTSQNGRLDLERVAFGGRSWPSGVARKAMLTFKPARLIKGHLPRLDVQEARLQLHRRLILTDIDGRIQPFGRTRGVKLELQGTYGGSTEKLWKASGRVDFSKRSADLDLVARRFSLDKLTAWLMTSWGRTVQQPHQAHLDAALHLSVNQSIWRFKGQLGLSGLKVYHRKLARSVVSDLGFRGEVEATLNTHRQSLTVHSARLKRKGVEAHFKASLLNLSRRPRLHLTMRLPTVRCSRFLDALPGALVPRLRGFAFQGQFGMKIEVGVDYRYLTSNSVNFDASIDYERCRVVKAPFEMSVGRLRRPFIHRAYDGRIVTEFEVGPNNPGFVPLNAVSRHVVNSLLTTEDSRFFRHRGFIYSEFRTALARNLIAGQFRYGASSITMQMVKNVLLNREKTLSRKLQELLLTAYVEAGLSKRRIMEIYLNVIEFGPGIYGIGNAARHYFDKQAALIEPQEAAFLSTLLPSPKKRYIHFCRGQLTTRWRRWVDRILKIMFQRHRLTPEELEAALAAPIVFSRRYFTSTGHCRHRIRKYVEGGRRAERPRSSRRARRSRGRAR